MEEWGTSGEFNPLTEIYDVSELELYQFGTHAAFVFAARVQAHLAQPFLYGDR